MKHVLFLLLSVLSLSVAPSSAHFPEENGVLVLDPSSFDAAVHEIPFLMVEFYAPWCPYCQTFAPKYQEAARRLALSNTAIKLAKVDAARYPDFATKHDIEEYPTLHFYREGYPMVYEQELEVAPLVQWVLGQSQPSSASSASFVLELNSDNFQSAMRSYPILLVEFYAPWCPHCQQFAPKYSNVAQRMARLNPNIKIAKVDATQERQIAAQHSVKRYPTVKLFHHGGVTIYDGPREEEPLIGWLLEHV